MPRLSFYQDLISKVTGVEDPALLAEIEDVMRHDIFHSTLDWQSRDLLEKAATAAHSWIKGETAALPVL